MRVIISISHLVFCHKLPTPNILRSPDCSVQFCYPTNEAFSPLSPQENVKISDGAAINGKDGSILLPSNGMVLNTEQLYRVLYRSRLFVLYYK